MSDSLGAKVHSLGAAMERLSHRWKWMFFLGALFLLLGIVALYLVVTATIASVLVIGIFMAVAGGMEIIVGVDSKTWSRFFLWIAAGLLYLVAGAVAIAQPLLAAAVFTLMLGAGLLATGAVRLWVASHMAPGRKALPALSALTTLLLGILIVAGWPGNSVFVLGVLLGVDLVFYGCNWIIFSLAIRNLENRHVS